MGLRLSLAILVLAIVISGCSKPSNAPPPAGKAMFLGCPVTSDGEDFTGGGSAIPKAIYSNSSTRVYAVGVVKTPTAGTTNAPDQGIIRVSNDGGKTFSTFNQSPGATNNAIVADPSNTYIYVAQTLSGSPKRASIHYTIDGGANWSDAPFQFKGQNDESLISVALISPREAVFVGNSGKTGLVVKLDIQKNSASLFQSFDNTELKQIAVQGADLLVVGSNFNSGISQWFLERWSASENAAESWIDLSDGFANQLDDAKDETFFNLRKFAGIYPELAPTLKAAKAASIARIAANKKAAKDARDKGLEEPTPVPAPPILTGLSGSANAILVTPDNFIFVAGTVKAPNPKSEKPPESDIWVVRRSLITGTNFAISDLYNDTSFKTLTPNTLVNYDNHVLAIGGGKKASTGPQDTNPDSHWHVRGAQDRYSGWVTLANPRFSVSPKSDEEEATAVGGVMMGSGDNQTLIVLGNSHEKDSTTHHWRIQKTTSCNRPH